MEKAEWLVSEGHTIGAHTITHKDLSRIVDQETLNEEIVSCGDTLETKLGISVEWFAYPFGSVESVSSTAFKIIKKRIYKLEIPWNGGSIA